MLMRVWKKAKKILDTGESCWCDRCEFLIKPEEPKVVIGWVGSGKGQRLKVLHWECSALEG